MDSKIAITSIATISSLGKETNEIWKNYNTDRHHFTYQKWGTIETYGAKLNESCSDEIEKIRQSDPKYKPLDPSVLFAIFVSRKAIEKSGWKSSELFGINIGSSRGATTLFEEHYRYFLQNNKVQTLASPTTTMGNISSWVAQDLQSQGPEISHSITCSTALHAILNGIAWLKSGMAEKFLVGGSEAPLTDFTIAQMQALKIYTKEKADFPNRALDLQKNQNTMILGEGAGACCLEIGKKPNALCYISGIGYATEILQHNISITAEADCFQKSIKMALHNTNPEEVDVIVMHAPGTIKGDYSEFKAIEKVFGNKIPLLTSNKWKTGHTFGASGILSLEMAILMIQNNQFIGIPFTSSKNQSKEIKKVLINAVGFGGNAVSILIEKP